MAGVPDIHSSELSFGDLDQTLDAEFGNTAAWLSGSDFDLLLGGQGSVLPDSFRLEPGPAPKAEVEPAAPVVPPKMPAAELWQGFPSTLFQGSSYGREFGASFDLPDLSRSQPPPQLSRAALAAPSSHAPVLASGVQQQGISGFSWHQGSLEPSPAASSMAGGPDSNSSPANSASGETPGLDIPPRPSTSPAKSNSWQRSGILKKNSSKAKPKLRAQTAQVAELKGQVAELTARCQSMEQVLTQQRSGSGGDARASPTAAEANQAALRSNLSSGSPKAASQAGREVKSGGIGESSQAEPSLVNLTSEQFGNLYRSYVSRVAVKLGMLPLQNNDKEVEELRKSASEVLLLVMRCCMENSVAAKLWMQEGHKTELARLESEQDGGQYLVGIINSLSLTPEQKKAILQLRKAFLSRLEGIQKNRQEIVQGLTGSGPSAIRNRASAVAQLGALQKVEAFVANVKECDRLICDFVSSLMSQILTPLQMARCLVAAYPYWPDTLAISTYIAAAAGESQAIGLLRQEFAGVSIAASS